MGGAYIGDDHRGMAAMVQPAATSIPELLDGLHKSVAVLMEDLDGLFGSIQGVLTPQTPTGNVPDTVRQGQSSIASSIEDAIIHIQNLSDLVRNHRNRVNL